MLTFCNAIEPPLTLRGPRGLLAVSHQMYLWLSGIWGTASLRKNASQHDIFVSNPNVSFCAGFNYQCYLLLFLSYFLTFSDNAFYLQLPYWLIFVRNALMPISWFSEHSVKVHLIFRYISLKTQWLSIWLSVIFHLNFNKLSLNSFIIQAI